MKSNNNILSFLTINDPNNYKVYEITNNINSKKYVGLTSKTTDERFNKHCKSYHYIGKAIRKYGRENFKIEILAENLSREEAGELEKHYIKELNTLAKNGHGYNIHEGGTGGNTRLGMSEEQKSETSKKMSESAKKARANRAPEEKAETIRKMKETRSKRTPEEKAIESKNKKEAKQNMTPEQKIESIKKWKESINNKTLEEKEKTRKKKIEKLAFKYTQEESDFILQQKALGLSIPKITKAFNQIFNKNIGCKAVKNNIRRSLSLF